MGEIHPPAPVLFILAVSSRHDAALEWARERCAEQSWAGRIGERPVRLHRDRLLHRDDGRRLKKQFLAFERLIDSAALASIKRETNDWEAEYAALGGMRSRGR